MKIKIYLLVSILLSGFVFCANAKYKIERLEPSFWWAGMKNPELMLMVYGDDISDLSPEINYKGVSIQQTIKVENHNYLFINLKLAADIKPGRFEINFTKKGKIQTSFTYELLLREKNSDLREGFNTSDVMYLITPDRFANGNPDNDNMSALLEKADRQKPGGRHGGDIKGISDNLEYITGMGFTAIWVNPVLENNQPEYSYHGYSTTDFYKVDERFGSNEEYRALGKKAKDMGVKLIMDMILNHCGSEHWWIKDLPTSDWINFGGEYVRTSHRRETIQDPYVSGYDYKHFADGWFVETMPDLNQRNPLMAKYLIQNTIWWIEYSHLAGIRMDTYPYPDKDFMTDWTCSVMDEYPNFNIVGEEWTTDPALVAHWQRGKINPNGYTSCLPSLMDFPIQDALIKALVEKEHYYASGLVKLYRKLANDFLYADPYNLVVFPDNHDMSRFFTQMNENMALYKMGLAYIATIRGIPQIYYGTEILAKNHGTEDHGVIRSDFPGGWQGDKINAFTGDGLTPKQKEAMDYIKKLLNWRKDKTVIHSGKLMHFSPENSFYVFFRYNDSEKVMVVLNKNETAKDLSLPQFAEMLEGVKTGKDVISGKDYKFDNKITVPEKSALILELK